MKKLIPFSALVIITSTIIIVSCTKAEDDNGLGNYNCHCTINDATGSHTVDQPLTGVTINYATSTCTTLQTTYTNSSSTATCTLN